MAQLVENVTNYINSLSFDKIKQIFLDNGFENIGLEAVYEGQYKAGLINYILLDYQSHISDIKDLQNKILEYITNNSDQIPDRFNNYSGEGNLDLAYIIYSNLKFHRTEEVVNFLKAKGIVSSPKIRYIQKYKILRFQFL